MSAPDSQSSSLAAYRTLVSGERPTPAQVAAFVEFVADAHSWYKHLRLFPPGVPFTFYLNPSAGMEVRFDANGNRSVLPRTDESSRFHYTWMTTVEYRSRFGLLDYVTQAGRTFVLPAADGSCEVQSTDAGLAIPGAVIAAGTARITAAVHRLCARLVVFHAFQRLAEGTWPTETGGAATMRELARIVAEDDRTARDGDGLHPGLEALLAPERARQRENMRAAIERMLGLVFGLS